MGGAGLGGRRPEARRAGAGHDAPKEAKPPTAREMRGGQRSGVRGPGGGAGGGVSEWVQVWVEGAPKGLGWVIWTLGFPLSY